MGFVLRIAVQDLVVGDQTVAAVGLGVDGEHDAFWLIGTIRERHPETAVLGCGARADAMDISRAMFVGADGFVDKHADPTEFLVALRKAANREMVLVGPPTEWMGAIADGLERRRDVEGRLTVREREVLTVAAEGLTARQIAERLGVRERTVTTHLGRIYTKLGVGTRVAAIRVATVSGLVPVSSLDYRSGGAPPVNLIRQSGCGILAALWDRPRAPT